jgi:peptidoglycan/LPS O-acetylase OafA/YrhL
MRRNSQSRNIPPLWNDADVVEVNVKFQPGRSGKIRRLKPECQIQQRKKMSTSSLEKYRPDIDGLRAVAVVSVVLFHAFPSALRGGFVGVDIFFVISGYLISGILFREIETQSFGYANFYSRRIRRIFPALLMVITSAFVAGWIFMSPSDFSRLGKEAAAGGLFGANIVFWHEAGYFDVTSTAKPLLHLWSLGVEEQFYLLWPPLLCFAWKWRSRILALIVLLAFASFIVNVLTIKANPDAAFYLPPSRFWELMCGAIFAYIDLHHQRALERAETLRSVIGLMAITVAILLIDSAMPFPGWAALLPVAGTCLLISSPGSWFNRVVLAHSMVRWIGVISYPLYLWHWLVLYFVNNYDWWSSFGGKTAHVIAMVVSVVLSAATYHWIEKPIRFGRFHGHASLVALCSCMCLIVIAGSTVSMAGGFGSRDKSRYAELAKLADKYPAADWRDHECFMAPNENTFSRECDSQTPKPVIFLWGDSYAAALYPGLKALQLQQTSHFGLSQYTASGCPPYLGVEVPDRPLCEGINQSTMSRIIRDVPSMVIIAANWSASSPSNPYDIIHIQDTVKSLRNAGVHRIMLVGPEPQWRRPMPALLDTCAAEMHSTRSGEFTRCGLTSETESLDTAMRKLAASLGVSYLSAYSALCDSGGCLTVIGGADVSTYDTGHLTPAASVYVIQKSASRILAGIFPH